MYRSHGDTSWGTIGILFLIIIVLFIVSKACSANTYNNGICKLCGGHYEYIEAVGRRYETHYLYRCNKCGDLIEINTFYNDRSTINETSN